MLQPSNCLVVSEVQEIPDNGSEPESLRRFEHDGDAYVARIAAREADPYALADDLAARLRA